MYDFFFSFCRLLQQRRNHPGMSSEMTSWWEPPWRTGTKAVIKRSLMNTVERGRGKVIQTDTVHTKWADCSLATWIPLGSVWDINTLPMSEWWNLWLNSVVWTFRREKIWKYSLDTGCFYSFFQWSDSKIANKCIVVNALHFWKWSNRPWTWTNLLLKSCRSWAPLWLYYHVVPKPLMLH